MKYSFIVSLLFLMACGHPNIVGPDGRNAPNPNNVVPMTPVGEIGDDGFLVKGRMVVTVDNQQEDLLAKALKTLIPSAYAATATTTVTYNRAGVLTYNIDVTGLNGNTFTGDTMDLGSVTMTALDDNTLKVCGTGHTKCTLAVIRVYTTGSTMGFVNTTDGYGIPMYAGILNPTTQIGLNALGSVQLQTFTIPGGMNRLKLNSFPSPTYSFTVDFSNGGSGVYSANIVIEYALQ